MAIRKSAEASATVRRAGFECCSVVICFDLYCVSEFTGDLRCAEYTLSLKSLLFSYVAENRVFMQCRMLAELNGSVSRQWVDKMALNFHAGDHEHFC